DPLETTPPPPARLSLTVSLNFIGLATGESVSPFNPFIAEGGLAGNPARITEISGNVLLPVVLGRRDLNNGAVLPAGSTAPAFHVPPGLPRSHSSQLYVNASPS